MKFCIDRCRGRPQSPWLPVRDAAIAASGYWLKIPASGIVRMAVTAAVEFLVSGLSSSVVDDLKEKERAEQVAVVAEKLGARRQHKMQRRPQLKEQRRRRRGRRGRARRRRQK